MSKDKPPLPTNLRPLAEEAIARHMKRPVPPRILVEGGEGEPLSVESPYRGEDGEAWQALLFQAFGTRSISVAEYFIASLAEMVSRDWDEQARKWQPSQGEFDAMIALVSSLKPRNEAQAAYAAQLCALHLSAMRLARLTTAYCTDPRTVAVLNKTVRAFGDGLMNLDRLKGKRRTVHQSIKSESHKHVHQHVHYHGGGPENGGQPHTTSPAGIIEASAQVPGQMSVGAIVPLPRRQGQESLPDARGKGKRSAEGQGERGLQARRLDE
jgi:hypothetical protein